MNESPVQVSVADVQANVPRTGWATLDFVIAMVAILMSAISLFVAVQNSRTERALLAASSWPFLRTIISNEYNNGREVAFGVSNGGVGPAKLKSLEVFYEGQPISSPLELLRRCCGLSSDAAEVRRQMPKGFTTSVADESVLRPGEENVVMSVYRLSGSPEVPDRFAANLLKLGFRACYCSVLDECWTGDLQSTRVTPVDQCKPPSHPFDPHGS